MVNQGGEIRMQRTTKQHKKSPNFILGDDLDFYEEYVINLTDEGQQEFFGDNPDFMSEYPIDRERIYLLRDNLFRRILRQIKRYETEKRVI